MDSNSLIDNKKNNLLPVSNIETVDTALFNYVDNKLNIFCTTDQGFKKVPVIWSNSERSFQIKNNVLIRDSNGSLIPPIISINRKNITKDLSKKGVFQANLAPNNNRVFYKTEINQEKTSNFANSDSLKKSGQLNFLTSKKNKKIVYKHTAVLMPVYVMIDYEIQILTNYLQQMNEIIQPFMTKTAALNYFIIEHESFRYECFIQQDFSQETVNLEDEERKYKSTVVIKVLGQLVGDGVNQETPTEITIENPAEIKFARGENVSIVSEEFGRQKKVPQNMSVSSLVATSVLVKKTFLIGGGTNSIYNVNHKFNSRDLLVFVRSTSPPYGIVTVNIDYIDLDNIEIEMGDPVPDASYSVTVLG